MPHFLEQLSARPQPRCMIVRSGSSGLIPMRSFTILVLFAPFLIHSQGRGAGAATVAAPPAASPGREFVRENYTKFEHRIPMRDGVMLFTSVYVPKDVFADNKTYPIMMQ